MTMAEFGASSYRRVQQDQETILDRVLTTYADALVRFAYSLVHHAEVAEDIAAESIAIMLTKRRNFRDEDHMRAYLYQIAHHKAMDHLRRNRHIMPLEDVENVLGSGDPQHDLIERERNESIYRCMQTLPEQYRQVLQLAYFDGFAVKEICMITKRTSKQVYNLLARARASLKELLVKEGITYEDI